MATTHLHTDPELLEAFVLARLPADEQRQWEMHCASCDVCRSAVATERALIGGIRRAGRDAMKLRLRRNLTENHPTGTPTRIRLIPWSPGRRTIEGGRRPVNADLIMESRLEMPRAAKAPRRHVPWNRIINLAASIVVIAGIFVFGRWFAARDQAVSPPLQTDLHESPPPGTSSERAAGCDQKADADKQAAAPGPTPRQSPPLASRQEQAPHPASPTVSAESLPPKSAAEPPAVHAQLADAFVLQENALREAVVLEGEMNKMKGRVDSRILEKKEALGAAGSASTVRPAIGIRVLVGAPPAPDTRREAGTRMARVAMDAAGTHITLWLSAADTARFGTQAIAVPAGTDSVVISVGTLRLGLRTADTR